METYSFVFLMYKVRTNILLNEGIESLDSVCLVSKKTTLVFQMLVYDVLTDGINEYIKIEE